MVTVLTEPLICEKIQLARKATEFVSSIPGLPARDISLVQSDDMPKRKGLPTREGQGRLLHDLANIELQAVELCFRTLCEFPSANEEFRAELVALMINEVDHLELCLGGLADLGYQWGQWPVHPGLWLAVSGEDSLLDRVLIVHRYLEGNGLDSGDMLLRKLNGVAVNCVQKIVRKILEDEVHHVEFGSRWYKTLCHSEVQSATQNISLLSR